MCCVFILFLKYTTLYKMELDARRHVIERFIFKDLA